MIVFLILYIISLIVFLIGFIIDFIYYDEYVKKDKKVFAFIVLVILSMTPLLNIIAALILFVEIVKKIKNNKD